MSMFVHQLEHDTYIARLPAMMTSSNGNIFRVTGLLWGESIGHRWIPLTMASSDAEIWCFLWSSPEQTGEQDAGDLSRHRTHYDVTVMSHAIHTK